MSVAWREVEKNPNLSGGCVCYPVNHPSQPKLDGWVNIEREFNDLGHQSPHVYLCRGCPNIPKDLFAVPANDAAEATAVEEPINFDAAVALYPRGAALISEPDDVPDAPVPAKRKAAPATD